MSVLYPHGQCPVCGWGLNADGSHPIDPDNDCPEMPAARSTCRHCERPIVFEEGYWIDPEAPATPEDGDDFIWRETCDANHESFAAYHEPIEES